MWSYLYINKIFYLKLGPSKCSWGITEWCANMQNAKRCNVSIRNSKYYLYNYYY